MQLSHWGLDYFDLFLIHFPIALQYVDPAHRYPPEWFGDDGKVHLRKYITVRKIKQRTWLIFRQKTHQCKRLGAPWRNY